MVGSGSLGKKKNAYGFVESIGLVGFVGFVESVEFVGLKD